MGRIPPNFSKCVIGCQDGSQPFTVEASFVVMFLITWNYFRIQSVCDGLNCVPLKFLCSSSNPPKPQNVTLFGYRVVADVVRMRSKWSRTDPLPHFDLRKRMPSEGTDRAQGDAM